MLVQEVKNRSVRFRASEAEEMNLKIEPFEWWDHLNGGVYLPLKPQV